ncbi:MAG: hypothetical protein RIS64_4411 [Bacteroidota bacterium]|jgi:hypothetical protein
MIPIDKYYYIIYFSAATYKLSEYNLEALLQKAYQNNHPLNITGILMYYDGAFAQVLEGEYEAVQQLFQKISQDSRHHQIIQMKSGFADKRFFADWSMAFYPLKKEHFLQINGFKSFVYNDIFKDDSIDSNNPIVIILKAFFESQPIYRQLHG